MNADFEKIREIFRDDGLRFPQIPEKFIPQIKEREVCVFATRELPYWTYDIQLYVAESERQTVPDYVVIGQAGHGINSYAMQYYVVNGPLRMFVHLPWGGVYSDPALSRRRIDACHSLADQIVSAVETTPHLRDGERVLISAAGFYGGCWLKPGEKYLGEREYLGRDPQEILEEALRWLRH